MEKKWCVIIKKRNVIKDISNLFLIENFIFERRKEQESLITEQLQK